MVQNETKQNDNKKVIGWQNVICDSVISFKVLLEMFHQVCSLSLNESEKIEPKFYFALKYAHFQYFSN